MINNITTYDLKKLLDKNKIILIDVREQNEIDICEIEGSINIPLQNLQKTMKVFSKKSEYAIICHTGVRSKYACKYLNKLGYHTYNVIGGIECWANTIDSYMKRY